MADTLQHPATSPTTTITFDGINSINWGRSAMNTKDFGSIDGISRQASSGRTTATIQLGFKFVTKATGDSVRVKVKKLGNLFKASSKDQMKLTVTFGDGGTLTVTGHVVDVRGQFAGGSGAVQFDGSLDMNVGIELWS